MNVMRFRLMLVILCLPPLVASTATAAPFVNLNFEQASVPTGTLQSESLSAAAAFPGWTARIGNQVQTTVFYNDDGIGGACVVLYDREHGSFGWSVPEGTFAAEVVSDFPDGADASLSQLGDVPADAQSLLLRSPLLRPHPVLSINGAGLPLVRVTDPSTPFPTWGADIRAFAGSTVELRLSAALHGELDGFDAVTFSPTPVPEPASLAGICLLSMFARRRRR